MRGVIDLHPTILRMASVHLIVDGYTNIYAPLLPLLIPRLGLSLTAAGTLAMFFQISSSVTQLGFGHLADRWNPRALIMAGPIVAVVVLSCIGLADSAVTLGLILVAGGLGTAAFHPPAAALAHRLGGQRPGFAMSVYITGGTLGFSFGPLLFAPTAQRFGLQWTPAFALIGLLVVGLLLRHVPPIAVPSEAHRGGLRALRPYAKPLSLLYTIVVLRQLVAISFATFVPVMLTRRGMSVSDAGATVAVYLFASGIGGFLAGPSADRYGPRRVILLSLLLAAPFLTLAPLLAGWMFVMTLAVGGLFLQSTLPVNVTFGQTIAPISAATVSSLMMGFAWGTGGLTIPFVGWLADRIGIDQTLSWLGFVPIFAAACAWPLPRHVAPRAVSRPSDLGVAEGTRQ